MTTNDPYAEALGEAYRHGSDAVCKILEALYGDVLDWTEDLHDHVGGVEDGDEPDEQLPWSTDLKAIEAQEQRYLDALFTEQIGREGFVPTEEDWDFVFDNRVGTEPDVECDDSCCETSTEFHSPGGWRARYQRTQRFD